MNILDKLFYFKNIKKSLYLLVMCLFITINSYAAGFVDVSALSISASPVTIGKNFDISFSLQEYQGGTKRFEYIEVWIQDGNRRDIYDVKRWDNVSFLANQTRNFSATTFLDPSKGRAPAIYFVVVRGKLAGDNPFNFGVVPGSNAVNYYLFYAYAAGFVDVSTLSISASPVVVIDQNFAIYFSLKEYQGGTKNFEYIEVWIQDQNKNDLYDVKRWDNVSFNANQTQDFSTTTFLDPSKGRAPGNYYVVVRGKLAGDTPFNFGVVPGSNAVSPYGFPAISLIQADVIFSNYGQENSNMCYGTIYDSSCNYWNIGYSPLSEKPVKIAMSFTVPSWASFTLDLINVSAFDDSPYNYTNDRSEPPIYIVSIDEDSNGLPGAVMEQFIFSKFNGSYYRQMLFTGVSARHPILTAGTRYWLTADVSNPATMAVGWPMNNQGSEDIYAFQVGDVSGSFRGLLGAFRVMGTRTNDKPQQLTSPFAQFHPRFVELC